MNFDPIKENRATVSASVKTRSPLERVLFSSSSCAGQEGVHALGQLAKVEGQTAMLRGITGNVSNSTAR